MKPFKISMLSLSYLPHYGGLVSYMKGLADELVKSGNVVRIFTTDSKSSELARDDVIGGAEVNRISAFHFSKWLKLFTPKLVIGRLSRQLTLNQERLETSDILIIRHLYYARAIMSHPELLRKSVFVFPLVSPKLQLLNATSGGFFFRLYSYLIALQLFLIERKVVFSHDIIVTLSKTKKTEVVSFYGVREEKIHVVAPGVDLARFRPLSHANERRDILEKLGTKEDGERQIVLTVCRLVPEKNVQALIDAIRDLNADAVLYIVGDGPLVDHLRTIAQSSSRIIRFWGKRTDVELFYRVADVFALASIYEGFGHVFLEALASGCPIVGVRHNPPRVITATDEIVEHGINGYIAESPSSENLADALAKAMGVESNFRVVCRAMAVEKYSWESHLAQLMRLKKYHEE